ncbi:MAG TPA: type IV pili twitching motility protein PilT [Actinobacteria bacterium]|nr:type IV pili twitching motility protein PilT [Actinomycetota bacterium]
MGALDAGLQVGQHFVDACRVGEDEFAASRARADATGVPVPIHLMATGLVTRAETLDAIARRVGIEFFDPGPGFQPVPEAIGRMPALAANAEVSLPLRVEAGRLVVATDDPFDETRRSRLETITRSSVDLVLAERGPLVEAIRQAYQDAGSVLAPVRAAPPTPSRQGDEAGYHINELLEHLLDVGGSDLHLAAGAPPQLRINGDLRPIEGYERLRPGPLRGLVYGILSSRQREQLEENLELDMSHPLPGKGRFRVSVFFQRGAVGAVMRAIPSQVPGLEELGMPAVVRELTEFPRGLVLITGTTGSGKSTTLAAMIDEINTRRRLHIITVEDPIEFIHHHKQSVVNQREVGADTLSFAAALRHALRQDPDVILVGEMRDLETMAIALTAAETGHLVFATLHTQDAPGSVERIIDVFPPHQQQQVRVQLGSSLQGVIAQQLLPTVDGRGRVPAVEVMIATPAVRNLIREGKVHQIRNAMQAGGRHGMQTMDHALTQLVRAGKVDIATASQRAQHVEEFMNFVGGVGR